MSYGRRTPPRGSYQSSRLSYDEYSNDDHERGRGRDRRDYYDGRGRSRDRERDWDHRERYEDDDAPGGRDRYSSRYTPPRRYRSGDGSRSPYHASSNPHYSRSRSRSPADRRYRRSPPRDYGRREYYDRDAPREYEREQRDRDRDRDKDRDRENRYGGAPSRDVILEGLNDDIDELDIRKELDRIGVEGLNAVNLIRDRKTGTSRGFAFARFLTLEDSKRFLDDHFPAIDLGDICPRVRLAYSRERDDGATSSEDWRCKNCLLSNYSRRSVCFRCGAQRSEAAATSSLTQITPSSFSNDGARDVGETPSQFLLLRGLDASVDEEDLLKAATKLCDDTSTVMRVLLIRDRRRNESWRFGFAEFRSVDDAKVAYEKSVALGESFTVYGKPTTASYIHPGVFVPVFQQRPGIERWTFQPMGSVSGGAVRLAYWDEDGYGSVMFSPSGKALRAKAEKETKKAVKDEGKSKARKRDEEDGIVEGGLKNKKRKGEEAVKEVAGKKALPSHLQFWQNRHSELHSKNGPTTAASKDEKSVSTAPIPISQQPAPPTKSYANLEKMCCYLCGRKFNTEAEVNKHERISALHRQNLDDPEKVKRAEAKLVKHGLEVGGDGNDDGYRDRARERRQIYQQPANPGAARGQQKAKAATAETAKEKEGSPEKGPAGGKGAALLSKMGWTAGSGLGAQGTGITAPVVAGMYVEGVGLGAAGGKVGDIIDSNPGEPATYKGFVERTKEKAKARYDELNNR